MNKRMILVAFLVVALVAAPAIAQDTPADGGTGEQKASPTSPVQETPAPAPPPVIPPPEAADPGAHLEDVSPISDTGEVDTILNPVPNEVINADAGGAANNNTGDVTNNDIGDAGPVDEVSSDLGDSTRGDIVQDLDEDADADAEKKAVDADEVDAEDREDRITDRILADLKDGKKDKDDGKKDKDDEDKEDANKDGVEQSQDQDADSGDVDQDADVINTGDNVNQCVGILQVANTGNAQNATGITQFDSETDEIELEDGSEITLTPQLVVDCRQIILQIVMGESPNESKFSKAKLREAVQPRSGAARAVRTGAGVIVPSSRSGITATPKVLSASSAGRPAGQPKTSARSLPRTGGSYATLLGLGAGTLLIGGGLLVRRLAK